MLRDLGLLIVRLVVGSLLAGHGAQKLFGWSGGPGLGGTAGWLESMGVRPGRWWAPFAGLAEFASGTLTTLGLFHPLGPILAFGPMIVAIRKAHWGKPLWVTSGGAELPVTNLSAATSLILQGAGRFSLDRLLGLRLPWPITAFAVAATAAGVVLAESPELLTGQQVEIPTMADMEPGQEALRAEMELGRETHSGESDMWEAVFPAAPAA